MRWSIIRVIWMRELRDQLRDRRTLFMIAVLPILLYPLAGVGLMELAAGFSQKPQVVGVYGVENLTGNAVKEFPSLLERDPNGGLQVASAYLDHPDEPAQLNRERQLLQIRALTADVAEAPAPDDFTAYRKPLDDRSVDLVVIVPADFLRRVQDDDHPSLFVLDRDSDEYSRAVNTRFTAILARWRKAIKEIRFGQLGIPYDFDDPFKIDDPERAKPAAERATTNLVALMLRMFPFILVMWSLAGALYPAVDLCAGEKERGTMETLLISPASREEIVWGKFLTIWVFSAATALLNLLSMAVTAWTLGSQLPLDAFRPAVLFWSVLLVLPLSAFFSAVSLAVGAYARSSKEGQYYLMPLFLVTLPLVCLTLAPGVELSPLYSMIPVTGVALLLQKLISPDPQASIPWLYFIPVLAPMVIYSWLALRWAIGQFQREEVLFREAERLDIGLWLRRLFREKEALPTAGQAFFCFALLLVLRWLSLGFGRDKPVLSLTAVCQLAFTAAPPLFMALLLTTRPRQGLALRLPPAWSWPAAALLAVLCVPPLAWLTLLILEQFPGLKLLLEEHHPLTGALQSNGGLSLNYLLVLAVLPALCEELAFRGFILTGLRRRFHPWTAVFLSSFLFALFQMNVFQFAPHFVLGVILALIALRTNSVAPSMVFHLVYNLCFIAPLVFREFFTELNAKVSAIGVQSLLPGLLAGVCALLAVGLLAAMLLSGKRPAPTDRENAVAPAFPSGSRLNG
jgi:sodium transport system permease protein